MTKAGEIRAILDWHVALGSDETIEEYPIDNFAPPELIVASEPRSPAAPLPSNKASVRTASELAATIETIDDLQIAIANFDGCSLKNTSTNTVIADGNPDGCVLFIGEAPGAEEDRLGKPFVGPSGLLLDRMLASIGLDRSHVLISNIVFWRPPGNRTPTTAETATCLPFVHRMIELMMPEIVVPLGGPAAKYLLQETAGIGKLRGRWFTLATANLSAPVAATPLFHPAYLLRTPAQKRATWRDLLMIRQRLEGADDARVVPKNSESER